MQPEKVKQKNFWTADYESDKNRLRNNFSAILTLMKKIKNEWFCWKTQPHPDSVKPQKNDSVVKELKLN